MSWFKNLRTMVKLSLGFGFMAVLLLVVGALGLSASSASNAALEVTYERDMVGIADAYRAEANTIRLARAYRQGMLRPAAADKEAAVREVEQLERESITNMDEALKTIVLEENREAIAQSKKDVEEYATKATEAVRVSATDPAKALDLLTAAAPIGLKIQAALDGVIKRKNGLAAQSYQESAATYSKNRLWMVASVLGALLSALLSVVVIGGAVAKPLGATAALLEQVAQGDLTVRLDVDSHDEVGQMGASLNRALESMCETLGNVQGVSVEVSSAAQQLTAAAEQISGGAQHQASSLEETAASLEEIGSTVKQNADNAQHASQLANGARDTAEKGGKVVSSAVGAMAEITKSSKKIADIITTIDEIAFQTNLLALNAAVEAARAGEQGRGFGVVAAEVRSLSQRTASAAKEIRGLIADALAKVETGTDQVNESGTALQEIMRSVQKMTDVVSEIAAASREQDTGISQVNTAVSAMDQVTQSNASQTEELSATAQSLTGKADHLRELVVAFKLTADTATRRMAPTQHAAPVARAAYKAPRPQRSAVRAAPPKLERPSGVMRSLPPGPLPKAANGYEEF